MLAQITSISTALLDIEIKFLTWQQFKSVHITTEKQVRYAELKEIGKKIKDISKEAQKELSNEFESLSEHYRDVKKQYKQVLRNTIEYTVINFSERSPLLIRVLELVEEALKMPIGKEAKKSFTEINSLAYAEFLNSGTELLTAQDIKNFLERKGKINLITPGSAVAIDKSEIFYSGCSAGAFRSQALRAILINKGYKFAHVLSGRSAFNPKARYPEVSGTFFSKSDQKSFQHAFGMEKMDQLGIEISDDDGNQYVLNNDNVAVRMKKADQFYVDFFEKLTEGHFMVFSESGPSTILRLLEKKADLNNFTVTFFPYYDQICHPPDKSIERNSSKAYQNFAALLESHLEEKTTP